MFELLRTLREGSDRGQWAIPEWPIFGIPGHLRTVPGHPQGILKHSQEPLGHREKETATIQPRNSTRSRYAACMPAQPPAAVTRTTKAFRKLGCHGDLIHIAQDEPSGTGAQRNHAPQTATAHTQMYEADGDPILVIVAGTLSLDEMSLAGVLGVGAVTAVPDHVAANWTRQDARAMAPVGHPAVLPVVIDVELSRHPYVWVPAGHPDYLFTTSYAELLRITAGTAAEIVEHSDPDAASTTTK